MTKPIPCRPLPMILRIPRALVLALTFVALMAIVWADLVYDLIGCLRGTK